MSSQDFVYGFVALNPHEALPEREVGDRFAAIINSDLPAVALTCRVFSEPNTGFQCQIVSFGFCRKNISYAWQEFISAYEKCLSTVSANYSIVALHPEAKLDKEVSYLYMLGFSDPHNPGSNKWTKFERVIGSDKSCTKSSLVL